VREYWKNGWGTMTASELIDLEIKLLMEGIFQVYGYDFREYAEASLRRRMTQWLSGSGFATLSEAQSRLLREPALFENLLRPSGCPVPVLRPFPKLNPGCCGNRPCLKTCCAASRLMYRRCSAILRSSKFSGSA